MKNIFLVVSLLMLLSSCSEEQNRMYLTGEVKGLKKGMVILKKANDTAVYPVDSIMINGDAHFSFSEIVPTSELYFLELKIKNESLKDKSLSFFAEPGEINIITSLENFNTAAIITGSKNQEKYDEFRTLIRRYTDKDLDLMEEEFSAIQRGDDSLRNEIRKQREGTITRKYLATVNFAINHNDYELAPYLMLSEIYDANVKYLDTVYKSLTPKIKDSKYGIALESFIQERKKSED